MWVLAFNRATLIVRMESRRSSVVLLRWQWFLLLVSEFVILAGSWFTRQQVVQRDTPLHCVWKGEGTDGGALEHWEVARAADSGKGAARARI